MGLLLDFRYALRNIAKSMRFTLLMMFIMVGSLTISLIGFNYIYTVAFSHSQVGSGSPEIRIFKVRNPISMQNRFEYSMLPQLRELDEVKQLEEWLYIAPASVWVSDAERGSHYRGSYVDERFFQFLDIKPALGRFYTADDFVGAAQNVVVISDYLWLHLFQGSKDVIGRTMVVDQKPYEIIGVMPKHNNFPIFSKLWLPLKGNNTAPADVIDIIYKMPNKTIEAKLEQRLSLFFTDYAKQRVSQSALEVDKAVRVESMTLVEYNTDGEAVFIFTLFMAGIVLILLISSINIGNLLFAKIIERQKESAIRAAIGAKKLRVVQQHACEGLVYCVSSWVVALLLTDLGLRALNFFMNMMFGGKMPYWWYWQLNAVTILVSLLLISLVFAIAVLLPAVKTANFNINDVLRDGTRGATGKQAGLMSKRLLSLQVILVSFMLMASSTIGYVMYSMAGNIDGEALKGVYSTELQFQTESEFSSDKSVEMASALVVGMTLDPAFKEGRVYQREMELDVLTSEGEVYTDKIINIEAVSHLFKRELQSGRNFTAQDNTEAAPVVIISQSLAEALFGSGEVLGRSLMLRDAKWPSAKIVGIAVDEMNVVASDRRHEVYFSFHQYAPKENAMAVKFITELPPSQSYEAFYRVLSRLSSKLETSYIFDHYDNHRSMMGAFTSIIYVFLIVGGFALTLSLIGIYAMGLSTINKSGHEIGIRRTLGAKDGQIMLLFIKKNLAHTLTGLMISALIFYILCYLAVDFFRGVVPFSVMFGAGTVTLLLVFAAVCFALYVPVKRCIKVQPAVSLRME
ncbi:ABC transporter permease [Pseudoalteromonas sp. McH1-7]|uniref:ABC transporter permease n=1 Tax=unclassified Pseudoalteromonas TaxID=194690 RepID=UPI0015904925|nr:MULTISPECIES: ABC transporter permease [unclassified Pseudoalteromonas]NUZ11136.1 ABC transporter permease [Pseudoalteromonas sp. McH1-7]USD30390.1 ABC transporter permease [Pseudoalteromonas sp. SCSIO 43201]